jgi:hypothetical protein
MAAKKTQAKTASRGGKAVSRTSDDQALGVAINGEYNTITPLNNGLNAYVRHPLNGRMVHCDTRSQKFIDTLAELRDLGLGGRITRELAALAKVNSTWAGVETFVAEAFTVKEEEVAVEA